MQCVFGKKIFTGKAVVENAYLSFDQQQISGLGKAPQGEQLGEYPVITPAFIDAHSHIGMARAGEPGAEAEVNERLDSILSLSDALDTVQMDDAAFGESVEMGVLYSCILPGSGNIIGGRSAVIRNYAKNSTEALVGRAGLKAALGYNPMSTTEWKGTRPSTRMGSLAVLRKKLNDVRQKREKLQRARGRKKDEVVFSAEEQILRDVLLGKERLRVHVHKIDDIAALLRLVDEFGFKASVEHAGDVHQIDIFKELKRRRIPVVYGPVDAFAYKVELKHENWRNVHHLLNSGVRFGLMTDHPVTASRSLLLQTRWFLRAGFTEQQAIELLTRCNAEILGLDKKLGTLEKGKWASFVCWNGNPFDLSRFPQAVYGEGQRIFNE
ncbi:MAG: imidazolonepropionase [Desulfobacteraceae bacterium]|nr:MAG: imidazolonepropionase [Desulfobacteraceae bacterium]